MTDIKEKKLRNNPVVPQAKINFPSGPGYSYYQSMGYNLEEDQLPKGFKYRWGNENDLGYWLNLAIAEKFPGLASYEIVTREMADGTIIGTGAQGESRALGSAISVEANPHTGGGKAYLLRMPIDDYEKNVKLMDNRHKEVRKQSLRNVDITTDTHPI